MPRMFGQSFLPSSAQRHPARHWLLIGVTALALAGLFALVLVVARTPALSKIPGFAGLFHESLVVHVNLSVLVWFLSIAALCWSFLADSGTPAIRIPYLEGAAQGSFAAGALLMALSPIFPNEGALMSNYIPVIAGRVFFLSLALLLAGMALALLHLFLARVRPFRAGGREAALHWGVAGSAVITAVAMAAFAWSHRLLPRLFEGQQYYDMLFWGGGHILQFTHSQVQMCAWALLASALGWKLPSGKTLLALFSICPLAVLFSLYPYLAYDINSMEFREFFTQMMIAANGIAPLILLLLLAVAAKGGYGLRGNQRALGSALLMSFILFLFGGALGWMIRGQNVVIPAHYHGSIVSVTLAFMGLAYLLLPRFGYRDPANGRLAYWQPIVYGLGQLIHVSGLAWSGGYGALRKTPGTDGYPPEAVAAMGMMGFGGLLAILGGLMFVIVMGKAVIRTKDQISA